METNELIDKYLKGLLSKEETNAFEERLKKEPGLKKSLELQKDIIKGVERDGLKQQAQQAYKNYKLKRSFKGGAFGLGIIVAVSAIAYFGVKLTNTATSQAIPYELNENGEKLWSDADKNLPSQIFQIDPTRDTVVETTKGLVFSIPAKCFLDENNRPVDESIKLEIKEALDAAAIIKAGLSSKSGDQLLESEGMFYLNARKGEQSLKIDTKNAIYAQIPTAVKKERMMLFEGKRMANGTIDWIAPKQMENYLIAQDINKLNFYPPLYLDTLASLGKSAKNKKYTDSLYYSFAELFLVDSAPATAPALTEALLSDTSRTDLVKGNSSNGAMLFGKYCTSCHSAGSNKVVGPGLANIGSKVPQPSRVFLRAFIRNSEKVLKEKGEFGRYANRIFEEYGKSPMSNYENLSEEEIEALIDFISRPQVESQGVNPAKIKAIWNDKFSNTLIATKEFEERLKFMHTQCDENILDL